MPDTDGKAKIGPILPASMSRSAPRVRPPRAYADTATGLAFAITSNRLHPGTAPALARVGELVEKAVVRGI